MLQSFFYTSETPHPRSLRSLDLSPPGRGEVHTAQQSNFWIHAFANEGTTAGSLQMQLRYQAVLFRRIGREVFGEAVAVGKIAGRLQRVLGDLLGSLALHDGDAGRLELGGDVGRHAGRP